MEKAPVDHVLDWTINLIFTPRHFGSLEGEAQAGFFEIAALSGSPFSNTSASRLNQRGYVVDAVGDEESRSHVDGIVQMAEEDDDAEERRHAGEEIEKGLLVRPKTRAMRKGSPVWPEKKRSPPCDSHQIQFDW